MRALPIRVRLTAWYFAVLAVILCVFALVAFDEMRQSILSAVDQELSGQVEGFQRLIDAETADHAVERVREELVLHGGANDLVQVADQNGQWVYRSPRLLPYESQLPRMGGVGQDSHFVTITGGGRPLRILTTTVSIGGASYRVQIAQPMLGYTKALERFGMVMLVSLPGLLLIASLGGYWMSRRALDPVNRITNAARAITAENLSRRLEIPPARDELRRLSETLNAMLERLEGAFERITQFTADASHELRTPLALIRTTAEFALRRPRSEAEYRAALSDIVAEIETSTSLVESLLFLARTDAGSQPLERTRTDLSEILREVCHQGRRMAEEKQIEFHAQIVDSPLWTQGNRPSLQRLFLILIDNAIKYTPHEGKLSLALKATERAAILEIQDSGIGISDSDLPHIFERFYRADKARSREFGGTGLGLAIGRHIAEAHGGTIDVTSIVGQGSIFRVHLPLSAIS